MSDSDQNKTTKEKADLYETTAPLLDALYKEIQALSKKKNQKELSIKIRCCL